MDANLLASGKTQASPPTPSDGDVIPHSMTTGGRLRTDVTGTVSVSGTPNVSVTNVPHVVVDSGAVTVSGTATTTPVSGTAFTKVSTASTNAGVAKNAAGNLMEITISNPVATACYVKLYDKASAPTVGTDVPVVTFPIVASGFTAVNFGEFGKRFASGIAYAITAAYAATDTGNSIAGVQVHGTYL